MIDTLYCTKTLGNIAEIDISSWQQERLPYQHLKNATKIVYLDELNGNCRQLNFGYNNYTKSLLISFSAPNLIYGSSLYEYKSGDYNCLKDILQNELSNFSDLEIEEFSLSRMDICANVEYNYDIAALIQTLFNSTPQKVEGKEKSIFKSTYTLFNKSEKLNIYDKMRYNNEVKKYHIPAEFVDKNILRFELQLLNKGSFNAKKRFGRCLTFKDIPAVCTRMSELLLKEVNSVFNKTYANDNLSDISSFLRSAGHKQLIHLYLFLLLHNEIINYNSFEIILNQYSNNKKHTYRKRKDFEKLYKLLIKYRPQQHFEDIYNNLSDKLKSLAA